MNKNSHLSAKEKIGYGLGDTASNLYFQMFINFLLFFYTDVFGIPAATAGTLFMVSRFWDAVNDPMMGVIADRTNTKWGKFRPYLLWMMVPMTIVGVLMFTTPDLSLTGKIIYAYITYILMMMTYTAINIPYSALMGVLSPYSSERTSASTYRFVLAFVGAFVIQGLTLPLVNFTGHETDGYHYADQTITLQENDTKACKIIVHANDGQEERKSQFLVKINRKSALGPHAIKPGEDIELTAGFSKHQLNLNNYFKAPQNQSLNYDVKIFDETVVNAAIQDDSTLHLIENGIGKTRAKITAFYDKYRKTDLTFDVIISEKNNQPPVLTTPLEDFTFKLNEESTALDLSQYFKDEDALDFRIDSKNKEALITELDGNTALLEFKESGISEITITANDNRGGITEASFFAAVKSDENNPPSTYKAIDNIELQEGFGTHTVDISKVFKDLDNDNLTYSITKVNMARGFPITMGIFGVLGMVLFFITFISTKERVQPPVRQDSSLKNDLKDLLANKPWMILLVMGIFTLGYVIIRMGTIMYYFKYYIGNELLASAFMVVGTVAVIAGTASTQYLSKIFGKKKLYLIVMALSSVLTILFYYVPKDQIIMIFTVHILISLVMAPQAPLLWAMYADTADYSQWKNGRRATGLVFSAATFSQKFGMAIGGGLAGWLLSLFNFEPNVAQSPETITGIKLMMSYIPAGATIIAAIAALFYPLDDTTMEKIEDDLQKREA